MDNFLSNIETKSARIAAGFFVGGFTRAYGEKELGYKETRIYQLADAGEISLQLGYSQEPAIADSPPPESQLRPLKAVPEEERKAIWDEATRKAEEEHAKLTAQRAFLWAG